MSKSVAIIGSRRINPKQFDYLTSVAKAFARRGWVVRTGCADGADYASMVGCREINPSLLQIILPWETYNKQYHKPSDYRLIYNNQEPYFKDWTESVKKYHPAPQRLSQGAFKLMARNYGIIKGADVVVALPMSLADVGGTGQGMRIAQDLNIPLYVVCEKDDRLRLKKFIEGIEIK